MKVLDDEFLLLHEVEVVAEFPHDPDAFTQGLVYAGDDELHEMIFSNAFSLLTLDLHYRVFGLLNGIEWDSDKQRLLGNESLYSRMTF